MTEIAQLVGVTVAPALAIFANADFRGAIPIKAGVDLTGIAFRMQIRASVGATAVLAELSTANGMLTTDAQGNLAYALPAARTKFLAPYAGTSGVADIIAEADGETINLCAAPLSVAIGAGVTTV